MVYISDRIRKAHPQCSRSPQPEATSIQAGDQKAIFLRVVESWNEILPV
jgi:hypothetical protein